MKLPDNSIGISDETDFAECPRRFSYSMRRHTGRGSQSDERIPEKASYATGFGSAIHVCVEVVEDGFDDEVAISKAFKLYGHVLDPGDQDQLREDLAVYRSRDFPNTRTVASEDEFRVYLFTYKGERIFFRFKVDRLYERLDQPGTFVHIDYKSSRHPKTQKEIHEDLQMWAYNFGIHEVFPEVEHLEQVYDQLRFGQLPTRKSEDQRRQIKEWLIRQATLILEADDFQADGLLPYRLNQWCPWCPILESCGIVADLTDYAQTRIAALAPAEKQGRRTVLNLDAARMGEYTGELEKVKTARTVLKRFEESVRGVLRDMPAERRAEFGFDLKGRAANVFTPRAAEALHERLGDRFYDVVNLTKSGLEAQLVEDPDLLEWALGLAEPITGAEIIVPRRDAA